MLTPIMKRFVSVMSVALLILLSLAPSPSRTARAADPIEIDTCLELQAMADDLAADYVLTSGVDCAESEDWNEGAGFAPIGDLGAPFTGTFDGGDFTIANLFIDRGTTDYVGLFGATNGATISHLGVGGTVIGQDNTGGLIGKAQNTILVNVHMHVTVTGRDATGGLIGYGTGTTSVEYGSSSANISGRYSVGGIVGQLYSTSTPVISYTYNDESIAGDSNVGGLVGWMQQGSILDSYSQSSVTGGPDGFGSIGGLVGASEHGTITNSYASGGITNNSAVDAFSPTGGLVGTSQGDTLTVTDCFFAGAVSSLAASPHTGGVVGWVYDGHTPIFDNVYWDTNSGMANCMDGGAAAECTGVDSDAEVGFWQSPDVQPVVEWDLRWIWYLEDASHYPILFGYGYEPDPIEFFVTPTSGGGGEVACELAPETDCSLQEALTVSQGNGESNVIHLAAGTYTAETGYTYAAQTNDRDLTLIGTDGRDATVIETLGGDFIMHLEMRGDVTVSGLSFNDHATGTGLHINDLEREDGVMNVVVEDARFEGNGARGLQIVGDHVSGSILVNDSVFTSNTHAGHGAGLYVYAGSGFASPVTIMDCTFTDNLASEEGANGGGAYVYTEASDSPVTVTGSLFSGNDASAAGGGLFSATGGDDSTITIGGDGEGEGNQFENNQASADNGGGFSVTTNAQDAPITVQANTATGNSAYWGGGFFVDTNGTGDSRVTITENTVGGSGEGEGNYAETEGGGFFTWIGGGATITGNHVLENDADGVGGGAYFSVDRGDDNTETALITDNLFEGNTASTGAGFNLNADCDCDVSIGRNTLRSNTAEAGGGGGAHVGLYQVTDTKIMSNVIVDNEATNVGAGLNIYADDDSDVGIIHNTLAQNHLVGEEPFSDFGGAGMHIQSVATSVWYVADNAFWQNDSREELSAGGEDFFFDADTVNDVTFDHNAFVDVCTDAEGTFCNDGEDLSLLYLDAEDNLYNAVPWFMNPDDTTVRERDYRLASRSEFIGQGDAAAAFIAGNDREGNDFNDPPAIGAYEYLNLGEPTVTTDEATDVKRKTARAHGTVEESGDENVEEVGFLYGETEGNYEISVSIGGIIPEGESFWIELADLDCNTTYYYAAFARSDVGTHYGTDESFETSGCGGGGGAVSSGGGSSSTVAHVDLTAPVGGSVLLPGEEAQITWSTTGSGADTVKLQYSTDGGASYATMVDNIDKSDLRYAWVVPDLESDEVVVKIILQDSGKATLDSDTSSLFSITDSSTGDNLTDTDERITTDNEGRGWASGSGKMGPSPYDGSLEEISEVHAGWYIRGEHYAAVYLVTSSGARRVFWDTQTFFTYADSWNDVVWVTDATLATLSLGDPLLPKPGVVLVKIQSDANVYVIDGGDGLLRLLPDETTAVELYGSDWADYVIDLPPTLFSHVDYGEKMTIEDKPELEKMKKRALLNDR